MYRIIVFWKKEEGNSLLVTTNSKSCTISKSNILFNAGDSVRSTRNLRLYNTNSLSLIPTKAALLGLTDSFGIRKRELWILPNPDLTHIWSPAPLHDPSFPFHPYKALACSWKGVESELNSRESVILVDFNSWKREEKNLSKKEK